MSKTETFTKINKIFYKLRNEEYKLLICLKTLSKKNYAISMWKIERLPHSKFLSKLS